MSQGASHCFALNGDFYNPEVSGVQGVEAVYKNSIQKCALHGPTNFSPVISQINGFSAGKSEEESQYNQKYNILLILTDGAITDMNNTIDEIVRGSDLPLSIIIVGLGNANFDSME